MRCFKIIEKECTVQDDGSTTATKGQFYVTIAENDLLNVKQQYLHYNVYFISKLFFKNANFKKKCIILL